jgi:hypothetical protein
VTLYNTPTDTAIATAGTGRRAEHTRDQVDEYPDDPHLPRQQGEPTCPDALPSCGEGRSQPLFQIKEEAERDGSKSAPQKPRCLRQLH